MVAFSNFVDLCKRSNEGENLQRFLLIWDEKYPSMIRRCLAMELKKKLNSIPINPATNELNEIKNMLNLVSNKLNSLEDVEAKVSNMHRIFNIVEENPVKKLTQKEKVDLEIKKQIEAENLKIIKKLNQN